MSVKAELRRLHSPDVYDLEKFAPGTDFGFLLQVFAGLQGRPGEESFDVLVCTPDWLKSHHESSEIVIGRHMLIVFEYDYKRLRRFFEEFCNRAWGDTWQEVASKLSRMGKWEFEDYKPASGSES